MNIISKATFLATFLALLQYSLARPVVRSIRSSNEFDRLLKKHGTETGLPVIVDFYSDGCGPCRMMAPIFKKVAADYVDRAVFVKVDTNSQHELSSRYQIRSLPTFQTFIGGKKSNEEKGGIGEGLLRQMTDKAIRQGEIENIHLELEELVNYFAQVNPEKTAEDVENVFKKCVEMKKNSSLCQGSAANNLIRKLRKKYKKTPKTTPLFSAEAKRSKESPESEAESEASPNTKPRERRRTKPGERINRTKTKEKCSRAPNLQFATKEQLEKELQKRLDEERDAQEEDETDDEEEAMNDYHGWVQGQFPERVTIVSICFWLRSTLLHGCSLLLGSLNELIRISDWWRTSRTLRCGLRCTSRIETSGHCPQYGWSTAGQGG